jgi:hypothetical protein
MIRSQEPSGWRRSTCTRTPVLSAERVEVSARSSNLTVVTVTQLPVTRCEICHRTVAYRPGRLSEVLTEHYRRAHPEVLGVPSQ